MCKINSRNFRIADGFFILGSEYYITARFLFLSDSNLYIMPTLFHHATEMFLKGYLVQNGTTIIKLKKDGHKLSNLWNSFISSASISSVEKYTHTIKQLDIVEQIRYPDSRVDGGFLVTIGKDAASLNIGEYQENYKYQSQIDFQLIDEIVSLIFDAVIFNPKDYFNNLPPELLKTLPQHFLSTKEDE